jgi:hypothetical protein
MTECSKILSLGNSYNVTRLGVDLLNTVFFLPGWIIHFSALQLHKFQVYPGL